MSPRVGAVIHAFYPELLGDIVRRLEALDAPPELIVTTVREKRAAVEGVIAASRLASETHIVDNLGRDIWPFLQLLARCDELGHEVVLKLHTKRSHHRSDGDAWRAELLDTLLGPATFGDAVDAFRVDPRLGLVGPSQHHLSVAAYIASNGTLVTALGRRLGLESVGDRGFFAGSMFYVRLAALAPLRALGLGASDFEPELGQVDGTLAHALERCFPLAVEAAGYGVRGAGGAAGLAAATVPIRSGYAYAQETPGA